MAKGKIIFLNGASSSGKTSIAKALQQILEEPYLHFGIDNYFMMLPESYILGDRRHLLPTVIPQVVPGFHRSIAASAGAGNNIIVDHVLQFEVWLRDCVEVLTGFPVLFVAVRCPLEELERRERNRNREQGMARGQYDTIHAYGIYDAEVDTSVLDTMACAPRIKEAVKDIHSAKAVARLGKVFKSKPA